MKTMMKSKLWMAVLMIVAVAGLASCDEDEKIGYRVQGHWFGDLDMWMGREKALISEIEFEPYGWGYNKGAGWEIDYYRYYPYEMYHEFEYVIRDGIIYMRFDDPDLDCAIADYRLTATYFSGYIADYYNLQNLTYFKLKNYDTYWDGGYGGYYPYYTKEKGEQIDSAQTAVPREDVRCYRGVNRERMQE